MTPCVALYKGHRQSSSHNLFITVSCA